MFHQLTIIVVMISCSAQLCQDLVATISLNSGASCTFILPFTFSCRDTKATVVHPWSWPHIEKLEDKAMDIISEKVKYHNFILKLMNEL